jgi:exodeoxyribonuclease VII small subunit
MKEDKLTYSDAVSELERILKQLENIDEVNIDDISSKVKRASELMEFCRKKLQVLDKDLEKMIADLDN